MTRSARLVELAGHLRQDVRIAGEHLLLTMLGGSVFLPGTIRKLIYRLAGATVASAPGFGFVFAGRPRNLRIGTNVYLNQRVFVEAVAPVTIGADSAVGMEAMILTSHHRIDGRGRWDPVASGRPVSIGERVWIGARAVILPGATIESDVIIAAGAVVSGTCHAHAVYAGVPARRIKEYAAQPVG
jgi:maltose O-acetyltransferase